MLALDSGDKIQGDTTTASKVDYTIHGLDNNAVKQMADGQLPNSIGDLYTADSADIVTAIILVNTNTSVEAVNLYLTPSGGTARRLIAKDTSLGVGYSLHFDGARVAILDPVGGVVSITTYGDHASYHENTGADEISVAGLSGLLADDQHVLDAEVTAVATAHSLATAVSDFLVASGVGVFVKKTLAEVKTLLAIAADIATHAAIAATAAIQGHATTVQITKLDGIAASADVTGNNAPQAHAASHQNVGGDEVSVAGLSGLLADDQHVLDAEVLAVAAALVHATRHENTGADEISVAGLSGLLADDQHVLDAEVVAAVEAAGLTFAENKGIILDAALSADGKWSGIVETGTAGAVLAFGDLVYFAVADSKWELTDASAAATAFGKIGICVLAAAENAATVILLYGKVRADAVFPALTIGAPVHMSETAGDIVVAAPVTSGAIVRIIGYGNTADELFFCPDNTYLELA